MILNVVHPYTFKVSGNTLTLGSISVFDERNRRASSLIGRFLDLGKRVVWHKDASHDGDFLEDLALETDESLRIIFDERVETVLTDAYGIRLNPMLNQNSGCNVFIGGVFERCFFNSILAHTRSSNGDRVVYVPELCSYLADHGLPEDSKTQDYHFRLKSLGVLGMSYDEVLKLLSQDSP